MDMGRGERTLSQGNQVLIHQNQDRLVQGSVCYAGSQCGQKLVFLNKVLLARCLL
jgi:hypothetical protein